jgi:hypothetical protein
MKKLLLGLVGFVVVAVAVVAVAAMAVLLLAVPRPLDTTEARVHEGDSSKLDHCALPVLDGRGRRADEIPKAYTPGCGWTQFPMPVLEDCGEPLAEGVVDMRPIPGSKGTSA